MTVGTPRGAARAIRNLALALAASAALLTGGLPDAAAQSASKEDAQAAAARVDALGKDLQALGKRLAATREARSDASEALAQVETRLAELRRRLASLADQQRRLDGQIDGRRGTADDDLSGRIVIRKLNDAACRCFRRDLVDHSLLNTENCRHCALASWDRPRTNEELRDFRSQREAIVGL